MVKVAVLCVAGRSVYRQMEGVECFGIERDAWSYKDSWPVVAHPPCAQWSRMRAFSTPDARSKDLAFFCLDQVKRCGGVLEHPVGSMFWKVAGIVPFVVDQGDFGFPARKRTGLYFVRCAPLWLPPGRVVTGRVELMDQKARSRTPGAFATWLVDIARGVVDETT